jgi:hypothetical protein
MADKRWWSKGDKVFRRSPRKQGKTCTCGRPFIAPRKARETTAKTTKIKIADPKEKNDSEVRILTESEVQMIISMDEAVPGIEDSDEA